MNLLEALEYEQVVAFAIENNLGGVISVLKEYGYNVDKGDYNSVVNISKELLNTDTRRDYYLKILNVPYKNNGNKFGNLAGGNIMPKHELINALKINNY